jgi:Lipocalin-like domain
MPKTISILTLAAALLTSSSPARTDDAQGLIGSWTMTSCVIQVIGEGTSQCFGSGAGQKGFLVATREGRWMGYFSATNRKPATSVDDRAALLGSMNAYVGRYSVDGNKITINVDGSHNEIYTGPNQQQVRFFTLDGDKLSVRTPEQDSAARPGKRAFSTLSFERER